MAIIQHQSQGMDRLFQTLMAKQQLELQKEDLNLRKKTLEIDAAEAKAKQEADARAAEERRQASIMQLMPLVQGARAGDPQAGAALNQLGLGGLVFGNAASPEMQARQAAVTQSSGSQPSQAQQMQSRMAQGAARTSALTRITELAGRSGDSTLIDRARVAFELQDAGMDDTTARDLLPPDLAAQVSLQRAKVDLSGIEAGQAADTFATSWLQRNGVLPEGSNLIPGAAKTLLTVSEARETDAIDWMQEGIDFVTGRVGDSVTGSMFTVTSDGKLAPGGGSNAIDVDQAVNEWKSVITQFAPEAVRERILEQLDSGIFKRRLETQRGILLATDIFRASGTRPDVVSDVREALKDEFTPSEISAIITRAQARAQTPQR